MSRNSIAAPGDGSTAKHGLLSPEEAVVVRGCVTELLKAIAKPLQASVATKLFAKR